MLLRLFLSQPVFLPAKKIVLIRRPVLNFQATIELSGDQAISDNLNSDAEYVLNEAAVDNDFAGSRVTGVSQALNVLSCAMVTVSSGGFPKTISIDFGTTGCALPGGVLRSGKISVILSDSLRNSGCTAVMTFDNYYVGGFKKREQLHGLTKTTMELKAGSVRMKMEK